MRTESPIETLEMNTQVGQGVPEWIASAKNAAQNWLSGSVGVPTDLPQTPESTGSPMAVSRSPSPINDYVQDLLDVANKENVDAIKEKLQKKYIANKEEVLKLVNHVHRDGHNAVTKVLERGSEVGYQIVDFLKTLGAKVATPFYNAVTATETSAPPKDVVKVDLGGVPATSLSPPVMSPPLTGGDGDDNDGDDNLNTAQLVKQVLGDANHDGGSKRASGVRRMTRYFDYSVSEGGAKKKDAKKKDLGRETDKIHEEVVEKIKELLGVDEETARIYKSVLYWKVKNEKPELAGYDRAMEMKKLVKKKELKDIDIEAEKKKRDEWKTENESKKPAEKKEKKGKKDSEEISADSLELN